MKKTKKIIWILLIFIILSTIVFAKNTFAFDTSGLGDLNNYNGDGGTSQQFDAVINKIISLIQTVGSIISVIALVVIGIKYMFAGIEEKAEYKKTMMPYLVGAIMVFGISNLISILYYLATNVFS